MATNKTPSEKFLNAREQIIIRNAWVLSKDEKNKLDLFFLIKNETWDSISTDLYIDDQEVKRYLRHEGREYEVILCDPVRRLKAAPELGLSFRVHRPTGISVVLIREWFPSAAADADEQEVTTDA